MLDVTEQLRSVAPGSWATLSLPLACFAGSAGLSSVAGPFALRTAGQLTVRFADIRFERAAVHHCDLKVAE